MDTDFALSHDNDWIAALEGSPDENHVNAIGGQLRTANLVIITSLDTTDWL